MSLQALITAVTDGQKKQVKRFAEDAVDRAIAEGLLDKNGIQKLIEHGGEFQALIITVIKELSVSNQFADEEVRSSYTYPKEYKGPKPIEVQIKALTKIFNLDPSQAIEFAKNLPQLPEGAEGWFAIPKWQTLAPTYGEAVEKVLAMIESKWKFYDCGSRNTPWIAQLPRVSSLRMASRSSSSTVAQLRVHARTAHALNLIAETQKGDILIIAAQLGMRHLGKSVRRAREVFVESEFGLGSLAVGSIMLTHPECLVQREQLHVNCAGDEFSRGADDEFSLALIFYFRGDRVEFHTDWYGNARESCGSASAFLSPQ